MAVRAKDSIELTSTKTIYDDANVAKRVATETNQYFWHHNEEGSTENGAHVTVIPQEEFLASPQGGNTLITSNGLAIRDGQTELATFLSSGVYLYDLDQHFACTQKSAVPPLASAPITESVYESGLYSVSYALTNAPATGTPLFVVGGISGSPQVRVEFTAGTTQTKAVSISGKVVNFTYTASSKRVSVAYNAPPTSCLLSTVTYRTYGDGAEGVTVYPDDLAAAVDEQLGDHVFYYSRQYDDWSYGGSIVNLADYGIMLATEPQEDVWLTVTLGLAGARVLARFERDGVVIGDAEARDNSRVKIDNDGVLIGAYYTDEDGNHLTEGASIEKYQGFTYTSHNIDGGQSDVKIYNDYEEYGARGMVPIAHPSGKIELGGGANTLGTEEAKTVLRGMMNDLWLYSQGDETSADIRLELNETGNVSIDDTIKADLDALGWSDCYSNVV